MATPAYVGELQQNSQPQAGAVTVASGQPVVVTTVAAQQYLSELQNTVTSGSGPNASGQVTPPPAQTPPTQAPPTQTQYVPAEMQSSPTQSSTAQARPQYIVVTVTEGSIHSSDSVSDSSPPPAVVQTGVPTQVVQQVQSAQQRSVVQATSQPTKTEQGTPMSITSLQTVHLTQEQLQQVPVQHVYTNQVQYVEEGDTNYTTSTIRSSSFQYTDSPLYTQTSGAQYYESTSVSASQAASPGTTGFVAGTGQIVTNPTPGTGGGATAVIAASGTATNGSEDGGGGANGSGGSYVIQGGYMLSSGGGSSSSSSGNGQSYSHTARVSPATVSISEGEENSVPSADKKV